MQIILLNTETLELITSVAGNINYNISFVDIATGVVNNPTTVTGNITTATTTTILSTPSASTSRKIQSVHIYNAGITNTLTVQKDISATNYALMNIVLQNKESLRIVGDKVTVLDASGREKQQNSEQNSIIGTSLEVYKIGTAPKAIGAYYSFFKDSGFPGAWALSTPGVDGVNIDGSSSTFAGLLGFQNPASGAMYLRDTNISATVTCGLRLWDLLWYNTGLVVTTTTAQTITQPALPARDLNGTSNGEGVGVAMYVSTVLANGAVTNTQLSYTNSQGVSGRVATIASVTAAASVGQIFIFQLQAGDTGVRSIQSITLGTTYVSGNISLFCYRRLQSISALAVNSGASASSQQSKNLDTRLYNGTAMAIIQLASTTTATNIDGNIYLINK